jgi:hypothetical protein
MGLKKKIFTLHIPLWAPRAYDFVVITFLTHPRKISLVVLQIGNKEKPKTYQHPYLQRTTDGARPGLNSCFMTHRFVRQ